MAADAATRAIEGLTKLVARVGSCRDAQTALEAITQNLVRELGVAGAAAWRFEHGRAIAVCAEGVPIDETFVLAARDRPREESGRTAWPLRVESRLLGVLAVRGELAAPVRALCTMLAGRCAHILEDARRAATERRVLQGLSHELRAPLQSLLGYVDLLRAGTFGALGEPQLEALGVVAANAERVLSVARDVLQVARIDSGHDTVIVGEVALHELVAREADSVRPLAEAAGLDLVVECDAPLDIVSDGAKLSRIVTNLLINAVKYTPRGRVVLRAGRREDRIRIEVEDTGPGIPEEMREKVFDEYVRLDDTQEGTGLGLAISRRLARLLAGELTILAGAHGGTKARLELPV